MSRLAIPVSRTILHSTGDVLLRAHVTLAVRDRVGNFTNRRFQIDSATDITTFPAFTAPNPAMPAFFPQALLQPLALLDYLKFTMDKDATSAAIYGEVIIEKK